MKNLLLTVLFVTVSTASFAQQVVNLPATSKSDMLVVNDSLVYIAFRNNSILKYIGFGNPIPVTFQLPATPSPINGIQTLAQLNNELWIGTNYGLLRVVNDSVTILNTSNGGFGSDNIVALAIFEGTVAAGTDSGLYILQGNTWQRFHTGNSSLSSNNVTRLEVFQNRLGIVAGNQAFVMENGQIQALNLQLPATITIVQPSNHGQTIISTTQLSYRLLANGNLVALPFTENTQDIVVDSNHTYLFSPPRLCVLNATESWFRNLNFSFIAATPTHPGRLQRSPSGKIFVMTRQWMAVLNGPSFVDDLPNPFNRKSLDINQVKALYLNGGDMFWDRNGRSTARYNVPKSDLDPDSSVHSMFAFSTWIGGMSGNTLHQSAQTYRQSGSGGLAYRSGPLNSLGEPFANEGDYDRLWKINRLEVELFKDAWQRGVVQTGQFVPSWDFRDWPGNRPGGGVLAPYHDQNGDNFYNWRDGDYPLIKGDQAVWMVYHDKDPRRLPGTPALGIETHCMAYAYVCDQAAGLDSVLNYTTFLDYKISNRSSNAYTNTYLTVWTDGDLGNPLDDYIATDVQGNGFYFYNGDNNDEGPRGYGLNPPAQGIYLLKGPLAAAGDGIDNNRNGVIDEAGEDVAFGSTMLFNTDTSLSGFPQNATHFFNYARARWKDNTPMVFGGNGYPGSSGSTATPATFMFPGSTDPLGWGIGGNTQSPVVLPFAWSEEVPGPGAMANAPGDRRAFGSMGPFNLPVGAEQSYTLALIWSRGNNGAQSSVQKLRSQDAPLVKQWYAQGNFPSCLDLSSVSVPPQPAAELKVSLYPNPAREQVNLRFEKAEAAELRLLDLQGRVVLQKSLDATTTHLLDIDQLNTGVYLLQLQQNGAVANLRLVKQ